MTDTLVERIRPGASVDAADGHLGSVERVTTTTLDIVEDRTHRRLSLPRTLIGEVRADGSVQLTAARTEIERLVASQPVDADQAVSDVPETIELHEERLVARKELEEVGRVRVQKMVEEVPRRLEVDAYYEEVTVEHVPIGRIVQEQEAPREEDGVYIVPVYEEQLVVVKRLLLKEEIRIRRHGATETRLFEETVRRERVVDDDPDHTGRVREHYTTQRPDGEMVAGDTAAGDTASDKVEPEQPGFLETLGRKVFQ
jgi:uncharacterized protein (TIGR02271 family)